MLDHRLDDFLTFSKPYVKRLHVKTLLTLAMIIVPWRIKRL